jgi:hypothetical protein
MGVDRGIGIQAGTEALSCAQNVVDRIVTVRTAVAPRVCRSKNSDLRGIVSYPRGYDLRLVKLFEIEDAKRQQGCDKNGP